MGILRCRDGTYGGAWIGVDQALAWCGEWCGLPNPYGSYCAFSSCYTHQISAKTDLCEHRTKAVSELKLMVGWG